MGFPTLCIEGNNVASSWREFLDSFSLAAEFATGSWGTVTVNNEQVNRFSDRLKLVAFRKAIGSQGREILETLGYVEGTTNFDRCVEMLRGHFEGDDSVFVKTQCFVTVRQAAGERSRDYLLRVEQLSRRLAFPVGADAVRLNLCMALAVNGLRSEELRTKMIRQQDLT